jgi:hypothetical protein
MQGVSDVRNNETRVGSSTRVSQEGQRASLAATL